MRTSHVRRNPRMRRQVLGAACCVAWALSGICPTAPDPAHAETPAEPAAETLPAVGRVLGSRVNVRIGPRIAGRPIVQLDQGAYVRVVSRVGKWLGLELPRGFRAALPMSSLERLDRDRVRVTVGRARLRAQMPTPQGTMGDLIETRVARGEILDLIETVTIAQPAAAEQATALAPQAWAWVIAPPTTRVYAHGDYIEVLRGGISAHAEQLRGAQDARRTWVESIRANRLEARAERAEAALRTLMGIVQTGLHRLRQEGGYDRAPLVVLANQVDAALEVATLAPDRLKRLGVALREDLEGEMALRVARRDAEIARARGLPTDPDRLPAPQVDQVRVRGQLALGAGAEVADRGRMDSLGQ